MSSGYLSSQLITLTFLPFALSAVATEEAIRCCLTCDGRTISVSPCDMPWAITCHSLLNGRSEAGTRATLSRWTVDRRSDWGGPDG